MTDIVFLHGLWISKLAWEPWISYFAERGYTASAPGWPGEADTVEATRAQPEAQAGFGIDALTEHFADLLAGFESKPVVIGHSFGGLLAQKLLSGDRVAGAVAIDPAPIKGVKPLPLSQLRSAFPVLGNPLNRNKAKALTVTQFRYGFGNALSPEESDALWEQWTIPSPGKPLFEAALANFARNSPAAVDTGKADRGPLLIISGTADHTVPDVSTRASFELYQDSDADTEFERLEGRGHSLTIDSGWTEVADLTLKWLGEKGFAPN